MNERTGDPAAEASGTRTLFLVAGIAAVLRIGYVAAQPAADPTFGAPILDGALYAAWAERIGWGSSGVDGAFYVAPGYAYFLALLRGLAGGIPWSALFLIQQLAWLGGGLVAARHVAREAGARAGIAAMVALALAPTSTYFASQPAGETLAVALALVAWTRVERGDRAGGVWGGLLVGLSCLARPNLLLLPLGWAAWLAFRRRWTAAALLMGCVVLCLLPATVHNWRASGHVVPVSSNAGLTAYHGNGPGASGAFTRPQGFSGDLATQRTEATALARQRSGEALDDVEADKWWGRRAVATRLADPADTAALVLRRVWWTLASREFGLEGHPELDRNAWRPTFRQPLGELAWLPLAVLLAVAAFALVRPASLPLVWAFLACAAMPVAFYVSSRYRLPMVAFLAVLAGYGVEGVVATWRQARFTWRSRAAIGLAVALFLLSASAPVARISRQQQASALGNIAATLEGQGRLDEALEAVNRAIALEPDDPIVRYNRGVIHQRAGDLAAAEAAYREALARDPVHSRAATSLASVMLQQGRTEGLIALLERVVQHQVEVDGAWINLVLVHVVREDGATARATLERARRAGVQLDPEMVTMVEALP